MFHYCTLCNIIHFQCTKREETGTLIQVFVVSKLCPLVESIQTSKLSYNTNKCHLHKLFNENTSTGSPWASSLTWASMCNWSCYLAFLWSRGYCMIWSGKLSNVFCIYFLLHNIVSIYFCQKKLWVKFPPTCGLYLIPMDNSACMDN